MALARADNGRRFASAPDPWVDGLLEESYDVEWLLLNVSKLSSASNAQLAQAIFERARQLAPNDPEVYMIVGQHAADLTSALQAFETAVSLAPDHADAYAWLGETAAEREPTA